MKNALLGVISAIELDFLSGREDFKLIDQRVQSGIGIAQAGLIGFELSNLRVNMLQNGVGIA